MVHQLRRAGVDPLVQGPAVGGQLDLGLDQPPLQPVQGRRVVPGDRGVPQALQPGQGADQPLEGQAGGGRRAPPGAVARPGRGQAGQVVGARVAAVERGADKVEPALDELPPVADPLLLLPQRLAKCAKVVEWCSPLVPDVVSGHGTLPKRAVPNLSRQVRPRTSAGRSPAMALTIPPCQPPRVVPRPGAGASPRPPGWPGRPRSRTGWPPATRPVTTALDYRSAWELLVATILSAQSTDVVVNQVTPELFRRYPTVGRPGRRRPGRGGGGHPRHRVLPQQGQVDPGRGRLPARAPRRRGPRDHRRAGRAARGRPQDGQRGAGHLLLPQRGGGGRHPRRAALAAPRPDHQPRTR